MRTVSVALVSHVDRYFFVTGEAFGQRTETALRNLGISVGRDGLDNLVASALDKQIADGLIDARPSGDRLQMRLTFRFRNLNEGRFGNLAGLRKDRMRDRNGIVSRQFLN